MRVAIETRTVDKDELFRICASRIACDVAIHILSVISTHVIRHPLQSRILRWYDVRLFQARARLDVPTYETTNVQRQLDDASSINYGQSVAFQTLQMAVRITRTLAQLGAQVLVLLRVLSGQPDGILLAVLTITSQTVHWISAMKLFEPSRGTFVRCNSAWIYPHVRA